MPVISGTLKDGAGQPVPDVKILLRAMNTTRDIIITTTASVGARAGQYRIEALPARYEVVLDISGSPPRKVGVIDVYGDSADGTLNDFLTATKEDYLMPDVMKQLERMTQQMQQALQEAQEMAKTPGPKGDPGPQGIP
ncbi:phage tail protein, partial [Salmonella enterica]|nr:phage tail protein [Salmonella enterica]